MGSKIIINIQEVEKLIGSGQLIALTAPLTLDKTVIVGFHKPSGDQGCIEIPRLEFNQVGKLLFRPTRTRIAVHGLKRIWEYLNIGTSELDLDLIADTKLMGYLLNPDAGRDRAEDLSLTHLAHEFLIEDYPHTAVELRYKHMFTPFHEALVRDARTILGLAEILPTRMDSSLWKLYRDLELPLMLVLDSMRREGIGIDGDRAHQELQLVQQELDSLTQKITAGIPVDLSSGHEVFKFLVQKGVRFSNSYVYSFQRVSTPVLEEIALVYPGVQAILDWRQMFQDVAFLRMADSRQRCIPCGARLVQVLPESTRDSLRCRMSAVACGISSYRLQATY